MASKRIGIIAEDKSDVAVIKILVERLRGAPISVNDFVGNGCGKIVKQSAVWSKELARIGCKYLLVVHDLDRNDHVELVTKLRQAILGCSIQNLIVIPVEELEAWLLSDEAAISKFFSLKTRLKRIANPETVSSPKEKLARLVYQSTAGKKRYVNSIHNQGIAQQVSLSKLRVCSSFLPLEKFVREQIR